MNKQHHFKRVICIVIDSFGVGPMSDSKKYNDINVDTFGHIIDNSKSIYIPNLIELGLGNLHSKGKLPLVTPHSYYHKCNELSKGKDTITGHYEIMGLETVDPNITFTESGFPESLIRELEIKTNHTYIGNYAASGTEIIKQLGIEHEKTGSLIIYTSADSVLQIAANESKVSISELYRVCEIARDITKAPQWRVGRVIARPFTGNDPDNYVRDSANRHDFALDPYDNTVLDNLNKDGYDVISIGKINDIFNGCGITRHLRSKNSIEGMDQTIEMLSEDFNGLLFTNLVDFDALWGHRRNIDGYRKQLEQFDLQLGKLIKKLQKDDLLILCADHGNDPSYSGSDHTRELIPAIYFSKIFNGCGLLPISNTFAVIGATISDNFNVRMPSIGDSYMKYLK